jgi:hypothetical protein
VALEQELPREQCSIEVAPAENAVGRGHPPTLTVG